MQIAFCLCGTSPLLLFRYSHAAAQISHRTSRLANHDIHLVRDEAGNITIPSIELVRVLRDGVQLLPQRQRTEMHAIFTPRASRMFTNIQLVDPRSNSPIVEVSAVERITYRGVYVVNVPRFDTWMVRGIFTVDDSVDIEFARTAFEFGAYGAKLNPIGKPPKFGLWGRYKFIDWRRVSSTASISSASLRQLEV